MLKTFKKLAAYIRLRKKLRDTEAYVAMLEASNRMLQDRLEVDKDQMVYSIEKSIIKGQPVKLKIIRCMVSDYYRLMDSESYPLYAPLARYLQSIGAYGDWLNIWHLPNGARVWIAPHMNSDTCFLMKLMASPKEWRYWNGWRHGQWSKPCGKPFEKRPGHITPQDVHAVVNHLKSYLRTQGY